MVADLSEASLECLRTLEAVLDFLQPLVNFVGQPTTDSSAAAQRDVQCRVLRHFLLRVCGRPLASLHQERSNSCSWRTDQVALGSIMSPLKIPGTPMGSMN